MAWTLAGVAARANRLVGRGGRWDAPSALQRAAVFAHDAPDRPNIFARVSSRRLATASVPDRKALEAALREVGADAGVIERAIASGAPVAAVAALSAAWPKFSNEVRTLIRIPVPAGLRGKLEWVVASHQVHAAQMDGTTCGPSSMAVMQLMGDPFVAAWLATGRKFAGHSPAGVPADPIPTMSERWRALQRGFHHRATRKALGLAPWPKALGTPPWGIADQLRFAGLKFGTRAIDDGDERDAAALEAHIRAALADGIPVPLYSSGDSQRGLDSVVPRHVVLVVGVEQDHFDVYEPGSGAVHQLSIEALRAGDQRARAAIGGWSRLAWVVLPRSRKVSLDS